MAECLSTHQPLAERRAAPPVDHSHPKPDGSQTNQWPIVYHVVCAPVKRFFAPLGNQAYLHTWPKEVQIISSQATRESIEQRGIPRVKHETVAVPKEIEQFKADLARASRPQQKATIEENLRQTQEYLDELKSMRVTLPTITFHCSLVLYQKSRVVEILWLGRAHTDGDVFVYLRKEKVIASGDALHGWMPYMGDGYAYDWIKTLKNAERLDFDCVIGGHGDVMRGKAQFELWKSYISGLMAETAAAYAQGATMAEGSRTKCRCRAAALTAPFRGERPKHGIPAPQRTVTPPGHAASATHTPLDQSGDVSGDSR